MQPAYGSRVKWTPLLPEEFLDFADDFHKTVHFGFRIVEIEARARGGLDAELVHERLRTMVTAAQRDARLVGKSNDIVRVNIPKKEANKAGVLAGIRPGAEEADI